jgi:hypothetical protein
MPERRFTSELRLAIAHESFSQVKRPMMFHQKALVLAALIAAAVVPALSQGSLPAGSQVCFIQGPDQPADLLTRIAACSLVIGNSAASTEQRAEAYLRRGFAHVQRAGQSNSKDDAERALADLSEAGRLVPSNQDVQRYVREARAGLLQLAQPVGRKSPETGNKGTDTKQVELLMAELQRAQEAAKAMEQRLAALEAAKLSTPAPAPPTEPNPAGPDAAKLARDLQSELRRVGCDPGAVDAQWGKMSQQALQKFTQHSALALPLGEPTTVALGAVSARQDRVCPLVCDDDETEVNGTCVARPRAKRRRPYASPRPARSPSTSSERPSGGPSIGITIGVGRRGGIGIGF